MKKNIFLLLSMFASLNALAQTEQQIDDVVVTGTRSATTARTLPFTVSTVDKATLSEMQRTSILPTLTEQVPGLFVTQRGMMGYGVSTGAAGGMSMRGVSSGTGQLLVLIDGQPQYQGVFGHSIADSYLTNTAEKVEVLRGPASVLYGSNAMGGVVNIITAGSNVGNKDFMKTHINLGAGSWGTVQADITNSMRKGKFSSVVSANYQRTDNHQPRMGFEQYGGYAKVGYDFSDKWNLFGDVNITHFNASNPGTTASPLFDNDQWITRGTATIALQNRFEKTSGRFSVYNSWGRHKINDGHGAAEAPKTDYFRSNDALFGVSWYQNAQLWKGNNLTVGADYQHIFGHAYYTDMTTGEVVTTKQRLMQSTRRNMNEVAGYVDMRQTLTPWLTLDAGVRYDYHNVSGGEWVPQFAAMARPSQTSEVRLSASKGFRNPIIKEMYLYGSANEELLPERMWNYELSYRQSLNEGKVKYGINLFLINGDNMVQTISKKNVNTGSISNRGVEVEASWDVCQYLTLTTNHSFLNMKHHVVAAPEYKGYVAMKMRYNKWNAVLGLQQLSGIFSSVNASDPSKDKKSYATLLNASVGYQLKPAISLWAKGENLLCRKYELQAGYPMPRATFMGGVGIAF